MTFKALNEVIGYVNKLCVVVLASWLGGLESMFTQRKNNKCQRSYISFKVK